MEIALGCVYLALGCVYLPSNLNEAEIDEFHDYIKNFYDKLCVESPHTAIILGVDFNQEDNDGTINSSITYTGSCNDNAPNLNYNDAPNLNNQSVEHEFPKDQSFPPINVVVSDNHKQNNGSNILISQIHILDHASPNETIMKL
jgi:hypothetical protein